MQDHHNDQIGWPKRQSAQEIATFTSFDFDEKYERE